MGLGGPTAVSGIRKNLAAASVIAFLAFPVEASAESADDLQDEPENPARPGTVPTADEQTQPQAAPPGGWVFGGALTAHAQSDFIYANPHPATGISGQLQPATAVPGRNGVRSSTFLDADLQLFANYSDWLSFNSDIQLERTRWASLDSYYMDANGFLNNEGLTLRQLYATVRPVEGLSVYGGKIHPAFGSGYELMPGQFYSFAKDYEQEERIGFGTEYRLPVSWGLPEARVSFEIFYLDTTFLSNALISRASLDDPIAERPKRFTRSQFGPSNTGALNSYTIAFRGGAPERGLRYQLSYTSEAAAEPEGRTMHGASGAISYDSFKLLSTGWALVPYVEYAWFNNYENIPNLTRHYAVGGLTVSRGNWQVAVAGGVRVSQGYGNATDQQANVSVAYSLTEAVRVGGGLNHTTIGHRDSWTFGPSLTCELGL